MEFLLKEEECKRIDVEEKYELLQQEMIQQALEMDEKLAEMERTYMYRLLEQVPSPSPPHHPKLSHLLSNRSCFWNGADSRINNRMIMLMQSWRLWQRRWVR